MSPQHAWVLTLLDTLFAGFVAELPAKLRPLARDLPRRLGLTTSANVPWSAVFRNPAVVGLPAFLLVDSDRPVETEVAHAAAKAHLLAVIGARGIARIEDGHLAANSHVATLLRWIQRARNAALAQILPDDHTMTWGWAERQLWGSVIAERSVFRGATTASWEHYEAVSRMKQGLWFPACMAASCAGRWRPVEQEKVRNLVTGTSLGLQYRQDVVDWQQSHSRGAAWAVALLGMSGPGVAVERRLHAARVLTRMLEMSVGAFTQAAQAATQLGATRLGVWAREQACLTAKLAHNEAKTPGTAVRWGLDREKSSHDRVRRC